MMADKKRILFVDDEPNLLAGLRRMLRSMRREWEMMFVSGGAEALAVIAEQPVDVIVSDMRMPEMDGAELLQRVMEQSPETVRIVLSGQAERSAILRGAGAIHQYLGKPCDADTLKDTIRRACDLPALMPNADIRRAVSLLNPFASLGIPFDDILRELDAADTPVAGLSHLVSRRIGISTAMVQHIGAVFSGLRPHIPGPAQASVLLGLNTLKLLALSAQVFQQYEHDFLAATALQSMWEHSLAVSNIARRIAQMENAPAATVDFSAAAGLLHDVGKLILTGYFAEDYATAKKLALASDGNLSAAEMTVFGVEHAHVGAYLLGLWGMPSAVVQAVAQHQRPRPGDGFSAVTAVHIANGLEYHFKSVSDVNTAAKFDMAYLETLNLAHRLPVWETGCFESVREEVA